MSTIVMNHATVELPYSDLVIFVNLHPWGECFLNNNSEDYVGCPHMMLDEVLPEEAVASAERVIYEQTYADCVVFDRNNPVKTEVEFDWDAFEAAL